MSHCRPLLLVELVQVPLISLPVLVLGIVADTADVGAFSTANRISMLALSGLLLGLIGPAYVIAAVALSCQEVLLAMMGMGRSCDSRTCCNSPSASG